jgi:predicted SprT family Zn-dependent metalloprotease
VSVEVNNLISSIHMKLQQEYPFLSAWTVSFDNAKRRAGICRICDKSISISRSHIRNNEIETIKDTILHEFAHAIAFETKREGGHGKAWKEVALKLGAIPKARAKFTLEQSPWLIVQLCPQSNELTIVAHRFRRNSKIRHFFLVGRPETKGQLYFIKRSNFEDYQQGRLERHELMLVQ